MSPKPGKPSSKWYTRLLLGVIFLTVLIGLLAIFPKSNLMQQSPTATKVTGSSFVYGIQIPFRNSFRYGMLFELSDVRVCTIGHIGVLYNVNLDRKVAFYGPNTDTPEIIGDFLNIMAPDTSEPIACAKIKPPKSSHVRSVLTFTDKVFDITGTYEVVTPLGRVIVEQLKLKRSVLGSKDSNQTVTIDVLEGKATPFLTPGTSGMPLVRKGTNEVVGVLVGGSDKTNVNWFILLKHP